jgi:hypothetical protein
MVQVRTDTSRYLPNCNTIFEVVMLADQYGNQIGPSNPSGTAVDAFGRARVSIPSTPFELTLIAAADTNGADMYASMDWEEISR